MCHTLLRVVRIRTVRVRAGSALASQCLELLRGHLEHCLVVGSKFGHLVLVFMLHFSDGILAIIFGVRACRQSAALLRLVAGHLQYTALTTIEGPVLDRWFSTVGARCRPLGRTVTAAPTDNSRNNQMSSACVGNTLHLTVNTSWHGMSQSSSETKTVSSMKTQWVCTIESY